MTPAFLNVVCPVDFSDHARTAAGYAAALADHFKAQLHVLTVTSGHEADDDLIRRLEQFIAPITSRVGPLYPPPAFVVRGGRPGDAILKLAEEHQAELVVISTHGAGTAATPYGSTTLHVMRHSAVPLLVVPPALQGNPPVDAERLLRGDTVVLAPIDFHERARRDAAVAVGLAAAFGLDVILLHVLTAQSRQTRVHAEARLRELAADIGGWARIETAVATGSAAEEISRLATARNAGVIVMGLRGNGGAVGLPPGSIAYEVLRSAPSLVLALPEGPAWVDGRRNPRIARICSQPEPHALWL